MKHINMKGLFTFGTLMVTLLASKAALAKDCKEPMVFVSGIQEYTQPNTTSPVVRDGESVRVRFYCSDNKAGGLSTSSGLSKGSVTPASIQKKGSIEIRLADEWVEFTGVVSGKNPGDKADFSFSDGGGGTYTVSLTVGDKVATMGAVNGKANVGDSYTKPESDSRYTPIGSGFTKDEADKRFMPIGEGFGNDGRSRLQLMPLASFRTDGADVAGGVSALFGYHVPSPDITGFEFAFGASFARGRLDNRAVSGVPLTEHNVYEDITRIKGLACADIVAGSRVNIPLCGGLFFQWLHVPDTSIGQDPVTGTVWANHARNDLGGGFLLSLAFNVVLTGNEHRGFFLGAGVDPIFPFTKTYKVNGGENRYVVSFDTYATLGLRL